jgi:hypothetical protein
MIIMEKPPILKPTILSPFRAWYQFVCLLPPAGAGGYSYIATFVALIIKNATAL